MTIFLTVVGLLLAFACWWLSMSIDALASLQECHKRELNDRYNDMLRIIDRMNELQAKVNKQEDTNKGGAK